MRGDEVDFGVVGAVSRLVGGGQRQFEERGMGLQQDHGSRLTARSFPELIFGVRAAEASKASSSSGVGFGCGAGMSLAIS